MLNGIINIFRLKLTIFGCKSCYYYHRKGITEEIHRTHNWLPIGCKCGRGYGGAKRSNLYGRHCGGYTEKERRNRYDMDGN